MNSADASTAFEYVNKVRSVGWRCIDIDQKELLIYIKKRKEFDGKTDEQVIKEGWDGGQRRVDNPTGL